MPMQPMPDARIDESIRRLTQLDWPTRKIARHLGIAQSTVVRRRQKINTGPNPIAVAEPGKPPGAGARRRPAITRPAVLIAVSLVVLAAVLANILWIRFLRAPAGPAQVTACVRYSAAGNVTGITAAGAGAGCPSGWAAVMLTPGG